MTMLPISNLLPCSFRAPVSMSAVFLMLVATGGPARAECPSPYDDDVCDPLSTKICDLSSSDTWECDVTTSVSSADVTLVSDYSTDYNLEAWGEFSVMESGSPVRYEFCCEITDTNIEHVVIVGSTNGDNLNFTYDSLAYNLIGGENLDGTIYGGGGNDAIHGSDDDGNRFQEYLYGEAGNDSIRGHNGYVDNLYGGSGQDLMFGGPGVDLMTGGDDDDTMLGGAGDDLVNGQGGDDVMSGGSGNETMDGGTGLDVMCGDADQDTLDDGDMTADNELLWANSDASDSVTCGTDSTQEGDGTAPTGGCNGTELTSRPAACP